jgi:hypothetical protein
MRFGKVKLRSITAANVAYATNYFTGHASNHALKDIYVA